MRASLLVRITGLATGIAALESATFGQPQKLYLWPSSSLHGITVLDASCGGGLGDGGGAFTVYVNPERMPRGAGINFWGQLGYAPAQGFSAPCIAEPEKCKVLPIFGGTPPNFTTWPIRTLSAGWDHTIALSDDPGLANSRGLTGWGRNDYQQAAAPMFSPSGLSLPPWNIETTAKVVKISAGEYINIVLFDNGQIAAWGSQQRGVHPPANGIPGPSHYDPYIPPSTWRFKDVVAGGHFVMALILEAPDSGLPAHTETNREGEGQIISWGSFDYSLNASARGPGYRGYIDGEPVFESPLNSAGPTVEYTPPYDGLFAGHVVGGGIIRTPTLAQLQAGVRPGTVHLWGPNYLNAQSDLPPNVTWEQMQAGYSQWICGVAIEDWSNYVAQDPPLPPPVLYSLEAWGVGLVNGPPPSGFPPAPVLGYFKLRHGSNAGSQQAALCYEPNCDGSTGTPALTANDFTCFMSAYTAAQSLSTELQRVSYANCDGSSSAPVLTANDIICFTNMFARGPCP